MINNHRVGSQQALQQHGPDAKQGASVHGIERDLVVGVAMAGSCQAKLGDVQQSVGAQDGDGLQVSQFLNDPTPLKAKKPPDKRQPNILGGLASGVAMAVTCQACGPVVLQLHDAQQDLQQGALAHGAEGGNSLFFSIASPNMLLRWNVLFLLQVCAEYEVPVQVHDQGGSSQLGQCDSDLDH